MWGVTCHCPHCGEPVRLVSITTLVAGEVQGCHCPTEPDLLGPDDEQGCLTPIDSLAVTDMETTLDAAGAAFESVCGLPDKDERSPRSTGEPTATRFSNR